MSKVVNIFKIADRENAINDSAAQVSVAT